MISMLKLPEISDRERVLLELIQPDLYTGPWIAGGAVLRWLNQEALGNHDLDVFCRTHQQFQNLVDVFESATCEIRFVPRISKSRVSGVERQYSSVHAITWKIGIDGVYHTVQLIKTPRLSTSELFGAFDIRVCRMATDGVMFIAAPGALEDFHNRRLTVTLPSHKYCMQRIAKYMCYGYDPDWSVIQQILDSEEYSEVGNSDDYLAI